MLDEHHLHLVSGRAGVIDACHAREVRVKLWMILDHLLEQLLVFLRPIQLLLRPATVLENLDAREMPNLLWGRCPNRRCDPYGLCAQGCREHGNLWKSGRAMVGLEQ